MRLYFPILISQFQNAGLHPVIVENIDLCGYDIPTPIQAYTIPVINKGLDVIATAQTGGTRLKYRITNTYTLQVLARPPPILSPPFQS
jgi:hypothetical protein